MKQIDKSEWKDFGCHRYGSLFVCGQTPRIQEPPVKIKKEKVDPERAK